MSEQKTTRREFLKQAGLAASVITLGIPNILNSKKIESKRTESNILNLIRESTIGLYNLKEQEVYLAYLQNDYPRTIKCI